MKKKTIPQLDAAGYFIGLTVADESPLEPGVFLLPAGAVDTAPPNVPEGQRAKWTGAAWALEAIPQPEQGPPPPTPEQIRRGEITARLYQIDADSVRALRVATIEQAAGRPAPPFERNKLQALETEAAALRAELAAMG